MEQQYRYFLSVNGQDAVRKVELPVGLAQIGRQPGNQIVLDSLAVSRNHAQILCTDTTCEITDTGSANGTRVNGEKLVPGVPAQLEPGAEIRIGPFTLSLDRILVDAVVQDVSSGMDDLGAALRLEPQSPFTATLEDILKGAGLPSQGTRDLGSPEVVFAAPAEVKIPEHINLNRDEISETPLQPDQQNPIPLGLSMYSQRLIQYLPGIYDTDFMRRFLGIFESILLPIEWNIKNFDLFLDPDMAPEGFVPWLCQWFGVDSQIHLSQAQQRAFLKDCHQLYAGLGTPWALQRALEIYTGLPPEIDDTGAELAPHTFRVRIGLAPAEANITGIKTIIDAYKPAHTSYILEFK